MLRLRRNFAEYDEKGRVRTLYCKVCGRKIADTVVRQRPVARGAPQRISFMRNNQYAEIKIAFDDGSFHVTNGCKEHMQQISQTENRRQLMALYLLDVADDPGNYKDGARPIGVVAYDDTQQGIV